MTLPNNQTEDSKNSLSPDDLKKLTAELSQEIDQEIRKQLAEPHPFAKEEENKKSNLFPVETNSNSNEGLEVKPPPPLSPSTDHQADSEQKLPQNIEADLSFSNLDPLQASLNSALESLKEGDKIGSGWTLKKIFSTSFGNNRSLFYELENEAGAKWSLNPEEMKDLLKTEVKPKKEPSDLSPTTKETESNEIIATNELDAKKFVETTQTPKEAESKPTKEQIAFITKLHNDPKDWQVFNSFSTEQLTSIHELYEKGQLSKFGIDAHPLLDKISEGSLGTEVEIKSGDNFYSLMESAGHVIDYSTKDSVLLGLHILANQTLLNDAIKKVEAAGISTEKLPSAKDMLNLIIDSKGGNNTTYARLTKLLQFLPTNTKFRSLTPTEVDNLSKYLAS